MTWTLHRWVWRLEAPLFIGMPPAGTLNRCRLYIPARAFHGAVTAEIARSRNGDSFPDYGKLGWEIGLNCRFTYLYPAEKIGDNYVVWLPKYLKDKGLCWSSPNSREDPSEDCTFRHRLLNSRSGTAIEPATDSSSEGTLRETECINPWWRDSSCCQAKPNPVFLLGYVFLRNNGFRRQLENIDTVFVGGDTRYGLGKTRLEQWDDLSADLSVFGKPVCLDNNDPEIHSNSVWGHAPAGGEFPINGIRGMKELLGGWEQGNQRKGCLTWAPGSSLDSSVLWFVNTYGHWIRRLRTTNAAARIM
ncbi:MAG: hypothetical protein U9Q89_01990 [Thermodesulfobacteriota bacterium]|nr:hypothetical protein [Thermodesulfobacteriota bacterium]